MNGIAKTLLLYNKYKTIFENYCIKNNISGLEAKTTFNILDEMLSKSEADLNYRKIFTEYLLGRTSTVELRELTKSIGYDYWVTKNRYIDIDLLDAVHCSTI